jgi:hypothetical protein
MSDQIDMLPWFENWWNKSDKNPLYAWKAMAWCLANEVSLPGWVQDYFHNAAQNMSMLANSRDFRHPEKPKIRPDEAKQAVGEALGLWRGKSKNMFARLDDDMDASRAAQAVEAAEARGQGKVIHYSENGVTGDAPTVKDVKKKFRPDIQSDRKDRLLKHGRAMTRLNEK